jgi:site-specific DNA recombinase
MVQTRKSGRMRLIGYVRVSTEDQATNGVSLDAQCERLRAYVTAHDFELVGIERDEGVSGKVAPERRPGLKRALNSIRAGKADGVVFYKLDRLSRAVRDILKLADDAKRQGWHLCSVTEHIDTSTAAGKFMLSILASLAEMEREQIGERTRFGMAQVAQEGRARSSRLPFGYRVEGSPESVMLSPGDRGHLVVHEGEQAILREIMHLVAGGHGAHKVAKFLNARSVVNPRTKKAWSVGTMIAVIRTATQREQRS